MILDNRVVQSLWVGSRLSEMERMCISSFLVRGHEFHLYTYGPVEGVPEGTTVMDAAQIVPTSLLDPGQFQHLAAFADCFRYKLLLDRGGWWVDTDTFCLRPFDFEGEYVFSSEASKDGGSTVNNGNIKAPPGSPVIRHCWGVCLAAGTYASRNQFGPRMLREAVDKFQLQRYAVPPSALCPVPWWDAPKMASRPCALTIPWDSYAVHLWNEMWRDGKIDKDVLPPGSLYEGLHRAAQPLLGDTTALIKTFIRDECLFHCVRSLKRHYPAVHVAVADDGNCSDAKEERLRALGVEKYIRMPWNQGLSAGRNALLDACDTPYALLCDDDFSFTKDSHLERLRALADLTDIAAGLVYNLKPWRGSSRAGMGWDATGGNFVQRDGKLCIDGSPTTPLSYDGIRYEESDFVLNFFLARTRALRKVRWDERLHIACEHVDFALRAKDAGLKSARCFDTFVFHKEIDNTNDPGYMGYRMDFDRYMLAFKEKWGFEQPRPLPPLRVITEPLPSLVGVQAPVKVEPEEPKPVPRITPQAPLQADWRDAIVGVKVTRLRAQGYGFVAALPQGSPELKRLEGMYQDHVEETVDSASGARWCCSAP